MSLPDEHLQQALRHAPDRELAPDDTTRKAVLDYAAKALHQRKATWLQRCRLALTTEHWHVARWQLAGMSSAIAVLLVVVFWRDRNVELSPGEFNSKPIQVASAPTDNLQRKADVQAVGKLAEGAPQSAKDEKSQDVGKSVPAVNAPGSVIVATNESTDISTDKLVVASAPEAVVDQDVGRSKDASVGLKQQSSSVGEVAPVPAEKAAAVASIAERRDHLGKAEVDKVVVAKKIAPPSENGSEAKAKAKNDVPSAAGTVENNKARNITIERGVALANKDIQAGILRILTHGKPADTSAPMIDAVTGYRIQLIEGGDVSISLPDEIEAYNQTMRDWHARSGN